MPDRPTPGPWFDMVFGAEVAGAGTDPDDHEVLVSCTWPDVIPVCRMDRALTGKLGEKQGNARLIAKAPAMLEALRMARDMRDAQRKYFRTRDKSDLVMSKALERSFDEVMILIEPEDGLLL